MNSVTICNVVVVIREQEVKDLLQNNLLKKYKKLIDQQEQQQTQQRAGTRAVVEFSILVIFCVEVRLPSWTKKYHFMSLIILPEIRIWAARVLVRHN